MTLCIHVDITAFTDSTLPFYLPDIYVSIYLPTERSIWIWLTRRLAAYALALRLLFIFFEPVLSRGLQLALFSDVNVLDIDINFN